MDVRFQACRNARRTIETEHLLTLAPAGTAACRLLRSEGAVPECPTYLRHSAQARTMSDFMFSKKATERQTLRRMQHNQSGFFSPNCLNEKEYRSLDGNAAKAEIWPASYRKCQVCSILGVDAANADGSNRARLAR